MLAALLIVAGLALGPAREALAYNFSTGYDTGARNFPRDYDGFVPESPGRLNSPAPPPTRKYHVYGRTSFIIYIGTTRQQNLDSIVYDWRETNYCNVSHDALRNHERAHSRGWAHGKGSFSVNKAYFATTPCRP